ncbi:MAG: DUF402 domain-containing protein [Anaerolineae bacterium]|jgi:predicted RNA-binding protein associated with RNAse of E/G family
MNQVTVRKLDHAGHEIIRYAGEVLERTSCAIVLRSTWDREPMDLGFIVLEPHDRWTEIFYPDRWYNIFEIRASDGHLKGWYCNVTRPARITKSEVAAEDLALDLWVAPTCETKVLDREEFAALPLTSEERRQAANALDELRSMVRESVGPFRGDSAE